MSGRIGISLASTVSRVIEVPATHSSRRRPILAGLDRGDLVLAARRASPPVPSMPRLVRVDDDARDARPATTTIRTAATARGDGHEVAARPTRAPGRSPSAGVRERQQDDDRRRAERGDEQNGMTKIPMIAPIVFTAEQRPGLEPACAGSSRSSVGGRGNARPITIVAGSTTSTAADERRQDRDDGLPGSSDPRLADARRTRPATREDGRRRSARREEPDRVPIRGARR